MFSPLPGLLACWLLFSACLSATGFKGAVVDPTGAPIARAQVSIVGPTGVLEQTVTADDGAFQLQTPETPPSEARLVITASGFRTAEIPLRDATQPLSVRLELAPVLDSVRVVGSALDLSPVEQGGSVSIVPSEQIRSANQPLAVDLLRYIPGLVFSQTGATGGVTGLYIRGGYPDFNLVEIDGVPVNAFGGGFDFAHFATEELEQVEIIRGPQSAIYGPYANSGVVNFVTRQPDQGPNLDLLAEGGSYQERRFGIAGGGRIAGYGIEAEASRLDGNGPVPNSDYHNQNALLNISRHFGRQSFNLHGDFDSNTVGEPGPWGSDPDHTFTGIDTISRSKNNGGDALAHYQAELGAHAREEVFGSFFLNNNGYTSPYGFSFNKDLRAQGETRTIISLARWYTAAIGASEALEEVKNTYITDAAVDTFPIRRNDTALYLENRFQFGAHFFLDAGVRGEFIRTGAIPTDGYTRPYFPTQTIASVNPKLAAAWAPGRTRLHASFGTGIRPPAGFDLAFTDNPALKPERTRSFDAGIERQVFGDRLSLDATYFYNRFYDLIVILGGSLSRLSHYQSDNIANSRAQGAELSARFRPSRSLFLTAWYTRLDSEILSLNGAPGLTTAPFTVGQQLLRRPANSGAFTADWAHGRVTAGLTGYFRGSILDVEPTLGASGGLFQNPGYSNIGINLNYRLGRGLSAYGHLRNALNQHYEEVFGYPSLRLNFVTGLKWSFSRAQ